jgi:hypothetical protein
LTFGRRGNNFQRVVNEIVADGTTEEFRITVAVEATSQGASHRSEKTKGRQDTLGRQSFQTEGPIISGRTIDQDESIAVTPHRDTVTERNVHVDGIKKTVGSPIKRRTPFCLWNSSERSKRHGKLAAVDPFTAMANVQNMLVIAKFSTTHDAVNFF